MNIKAFFLFLSLGLFAVTGQANAYDRTPVGSEIVPPITTTLELSDFGEGCAGADSYQNWYQTDGYAEIDGSASTPRYSLPYTYEWTPTAPTGTSAWVRADCEGPGGTTSTYPNDAFSWVESSSSTEAESSTSTLAIVEAIDALHQTVFELGLVLAIALGLTLSAVILRN